MPKNRQLLKKPSRISTKSAKIINILLCISMLNACQSPTEHIPAAHIPSRMYSGYECDQIKTELSIVKNKLTKISGIQDQGATADAITAGIGIAIFWPVLFLTSSDDNKQEISSLKGHYEALESTAIQKKCDYADALISERKELERKKAEQASRQKCMSPTCT